MLALLNHMDLESSFFALITVPCWLIYRTSPTRLYRKARQENFDALEKLLSLDPLMLHEPIIGKHIQELRLNNKTTKYRKLLDATLNDSHANITAQNMKYAAGGILSAMAKGLKPRLSTPQIHKLFDAVALDFDKKLIDPDLPTNEGSFARQIYRHRDEWLKALKPDTEK